MPRTRASSNPKRQTVTPPYDTVTDEQMTSMRTEYYAKLQPHIASMTGKYECSERDFINEVMDTLGRYKENPIGVWSTNTENMARSYNVSIKNGEKVLLRIYYEPSGDFLMLQVLPIDEYFDVLWKAHVLTKHSGRLSMWNYIKYTMKMFMPYMATHPFQELCVVCLNRPRPRFKSRPAAMVEVTIEPIKKVKEEVIDVVDTSEGNGGSDKFIKTENVKGLPEEKATCSKNVTAKKDKSDAEVVNVIERAQMIEITIDTTTIVKKEVFDDVEEPEIFIRMQKTNDLSEEKAGCTKNIDNSDSKDGHGVKQIQQYTRKRKITTANPKIDNKIQSMRNNDYLNCEADKNVKVPNKIEAKLDHSSVKISETLAKKARTKKYTSKPKATILNFQIDNKITTQKSSFQNDEHSNFDTSTNRKSNFIDTDASPEKTIAQKIDAWTDNVELESDCTETTDSVVKRPAILKNYTKKASIKPVSDANPKTKAQKNSSQNDSTKNDDIKTKGKAPTQTDTTKNVPITPVKKDKRTTGPYTKSKSIYLFQWDQLDTIDLPATQSSSKDLKDINLDINYEFDSLTDINTPHIPTENLTKDLQDTVKIKCEPTLNDDNMPLMPATHPTNTLPVKIEVIKQEVEEDDDI